MKDFERSIETLTAMVDEVTNDDGSLDNWLEDVKLAIECLKVVENFKSLIS